MITKVRNKKKSLVRARHSFSEDPQLRADFQRDLLLAKKEEKSNSFFFTGLENELNHACVFSGPEWTSLGPSLGLRTQSL